MHTETAAHILRNFHVPDDVLSFARAMRLVQGQDFDLIYFLEKPWEWAREFGLWDDCGRPMADDTTSLETFGALTDA
jgi:hypothetical protein